MFAFSISAGKHKVMYVWPCRLYGGQMVISVSYFNLYLINM